MAGNIFTVRSLAQFIRKDGDYFYNDRHVKVYHFANQKVVAVVIFNNGVSETWTYNEINYNNRWIKRQTTTVNLPGKIDFDVSVEGEDLKVKWVKVVNSNITGYRIYYNLMYKDVMVSASQGSLIEETIKGLKTETKYLITMSALTNNGEGVLSTPKEVFIPEQLQPVFLLGQPRTLADGSVTIAFQDKNTAKNKNSASKVLEFLIISNNPYDSVNNPYGYNDLPTIKKGMTDVYNITIPSSDLNGSGYRSYSIYVVNSMGRSDPVEFHFNYGNIVLPPPIRFLNINDGAVDLSFSWEPPLDTHNIEKYIIELKDSNTNLLETREVLVSRTDYVFRNLLVGDYLVDVYSANHYGLRSATSIQSGLVSVISSASPVDSTTIQATADHLQDTITITWGASAGATSYIVVVNGSESLPVADTQFVKTNVPNLVHGGTFDIEIIAIGVNGNSKGTVKTFNFSSVFLGDPQIIISPSGNYRDSVDVEVNYNSNASSEWYVENLVLRDRSNIAHIVNANEITYNRKFYPSENADVGLAIKNSFYFLLAVREIERIEWDLTILKSGVITSFPQSIGINKDKVVPSNIKGNTIKVSTVNDLLRQERTILKAYEIDGSVLPHYSDTVSFAFESDFEKGRTAIWRSFRGRGITQIKGKNIPYDINETIYLYSQFYNTETHEWSYLISEAQYSLFNPTLIESRDQNIFLFHEKENVWNITPSLTLDRIETDNSEDVYFSYDDTNYSGELVIDRNKEYRLSITTTNRPSGVAVGEQDDEFFINVVDMINQDKMWLKGYFGPKQVTADLYQNTDEFFIQPIINTDLSLDTIRIPFTMTLEEDVLQGKQVAEMSLYPKGTLKWGGITFIFEIDNIIVKPLDSKEQVVADVNRYFRDKLPFYAEETNDDSVFSSEGTRNRRSIELTVPDDLVERIKPYKEEIKYRPSFRGVETAVFDKEFFTRERLRNFSAKFGGGFEGFAIQFIQNLFVDTEKSVYTRNEMYMMISGSLFYVSPDGLSLKEVKLSYTNPAQEEVFANPNRNNNNTNFRLMYTTATANSIWIIHPDLPSCVLEIAIDSHQETATVFQYSGFDTENTRMFFAIFGVGNHVYVHGGVECLVANEENDAFGVPYSVPTVVDNSDTKVIRESDGFNVSTDISSLDLRRLVPSFFLHNVSVIYSNNIIELSFYEACDSFRIINNQITPLADDQRSIWTSIPMRIGEGNVIDGRRMNFVEKANFVYFTDKDREWTGSVLPLFKEKFLNNRDGGYDVPGSDNNFEFLFHVGNLSTEATTYNFEPLDSVVVGTELKNANFRDFYFTFKSEVLSSTIEHKKGVANNLAVFGDSSAPIVFSSGGEKITIVRHGEKFVSGAWAGSEQPSDESCFIVNEVSYLKFSLQDRNFIKVPIVECLFDSTDKKFKMAYHGNHDDLVLTPGEKREMELTDFVLY